MFLKEKYGTKNKNAKVTFHSYKKFSGRKYDVEYLQYGAFEKPRRNLKPMLNEAKHLSIHKTVYKVKDDD